MKYSIHSIVVGRKTKWYICPYFNRRYMCWQLRSQLFNTEQETINELLIIKLEE